MLSLFKDICKQEFFNDTIDDFFYNWQDDQSIIIGTIKKIIKDFKTSAEIAEEYGPSEEAIRDFGRELLKYILNHNDDLEKHLTPIIENWDIDRVAAIDMILIKMSLSEMLIFHLSPQRYPSMNMLNYPRLTVRIKARISLMVY